MKKFKTMMAMMLALVSMCVAFSSCSSDDDDNNGAGSSATAEQVVGTYVGETMSIALAGQGDMDPLENATFKLEKVDDSHVNITLPAFGSAPHSSKMKSKSFFLFCCIAMVKGGKKLPELSR